MLVLKQFEIDKDADIFLKISGRESGILSFLLSLIGLDPITTFEADKKSVRFETVSVRKGKFRVSVPNSAITGVVTGWTKPFQLLVVAAVFLICGLSGIGTSMAIVIAGVVVAAICLVFYFLNKSLFFGFYNGGDSPIAIMQVGRSVIENVPLDLEKFEEAAAVLNEVILNSKLKE